MKRNNRIEGLVEQLHELKLPLMASALEKLYGNKGFDTIDRVEMLEELVGPEYQEKISNAFRNRLSRAHLSGCPQTIDNCKDSAERVYLPTEITATLSSLDFVKDGLNVCILGPSDSGKSYLGQSARNTGLYEISHGLLPLRRIPGNDGSLKTGGLSQIPEENPFPYEIGFVDTG